MVTALSVLAIALFAAAAVTDTLRRRIPNTLSAALALLGVARLGLALAAGGGAAAFGLDVLVAQLIFVLAAMAFRYGLLGGGDVKLLAAGVLWLGAAALGPYLLTTVLAGGALAAGFVVWQRGCRERRRDEGAEPALRGRDRRGRHPDHRRRALVLTPGGAAVRELDAGGLEVAVAHRGVPHRPVVDAQLEVLRQAEPVADPQPRSTRGQVEHHARDRAVPVAEHDARAPKHMGPGVSAFVQHRRPPSGAPRFGALAQE